MWQLIFHGIALAAWCVGAAVVVAPLRFRRLPALLLTFALGAAFAKFAFFALVGGDAFNPDLPQGVIWLCGWAFASAMLLTGASTLFFLVDAGDVAPLHLP